MVKDKREIANKYYYFFIPKIIFHSSLNKLIRKKNTSNIVQLWEYHSNIYLNCILLSSMQHERHSPSYDPFLYPFFLIQCLQVQMLRILYFSYIYENQEAIPSLEQYLKLTN